MNKQAIFKLSVAVLPLLWCCVSPSAAQTISLINPTQAAQNSPSLTVTVNGSGFVPTSIVQWLVFNGQNTTSTDLPTQFQTSPQAPFLTATIDASLLTSAGIFGIRVANPSSQSFSPPVSFTVGAVPFVKSVTPAFTPYNTVTPIALSGAFNQGDQITVGGQIYPSSGSATQLQTTIPQSVTSILGRQFIGAVNSFGPSVSTAILNVVPVVTSLNPATLPAGSGTFTLAVNVSGGLVAGTPIAIQFNGTAFPGTFVSATQAAASIPASAIATIGSFPVSITTQNVTAAAPNFVTTPAVATSPFITNIIPNSALVGSPDTVVVITGTGFQIDNGQYTGARIRFTPPGSQTATQLTPSASTTTSLTVTIPHALLVTAGTATVTVLNVTDGLSSTGQNFTIRIPETLSSLSPTPTPAGVPVTLVVSGANFTSGDSLIVSSPSCGSPVCGVNVGGTLGGSTTLTASVPATAIPVPGTYGVFLSNSSGQTTGPLLWTISLQLISLNPQQSVQSVNPLSVVITAAGGFTASSVARFNGQPVPTSGIF